LCEGIEQYSSLKNANEMKRIAFSIETAVIREDLGSIPIRKNNEI